MYLKMCVCQISIFVFQVNADVRQIIEVMANVAAKMHWLGLHLSSFLGQGPVLLFSSTKTQCEEVAVHLQRLGYAGIKHVCFVLPKKYYLLRDCILYSAGSLHGDKSQLERMELVKRFKKADLSVLCATDVAGNYRLYLWVITIIELLIVYITCLILQPADWILRG